MDLSLEDLQSGIYKKDIDLSKVRKFISQVKDLANKSKLEVFVVSEGASGYSSYGRSECVKDHRNYQIQWEKEHGDDPYEDWSKNKKKK